MSRAPSLSFVNLPQHNPPYPGILDFLDTQFARVGREVWKRRIETAAVFDEKGMPVTLETPYKPNSKLFYYREVLREPSIPFEERILFHDEHILVADKPHFLPVIPSGKYVNECLLYRLKKKTGVNTLVPIHRIDMDTAGIVVFSCNQQTRGRYQALFVKAEVRKEYFAVTHSHKSTPKRQWIIENRIERGEPWFLMKNAEGAVNARTRLSLIETRGNRALFFLEPMSGKKHQLRLHLCSIGFPILNDHYYPELLPEADAVYDKPLQLLAKKVSFRDPVTETDREFFSEKELEW